MHSFHRSNTEKSAQNAKKNAPLAWFGKAYQYCENKVTKSEQIAQDCGWEKFFCNSILSVFYVFRKILCILHKERELDAVSLRWFSPNYWHASRVFMSILWNCDFCRCARKRQFNFWIIYILHRVNKTYHLKVVFLWWSILCVFDIIWIFCE